MRIRICSMVMVIPWLMISVIQAEPISKTDLIRQASQVIESGLMSTPLSCLGISQADFNATLNDAKSSCSDRLPEHIQTTEKEHYLTEFGNCVADGMRSHFDISQTVIDECENNENGSEFSLEEAANRLNQGLKLHASLSDIKQVTLPLYTNHKVISHFPDGMGSFLGSESLPVTVLSTNDDIDRVISFYQSELSSFKKFVIDNGVIFMEDAPEDFDLLTHIGLYTSTPHVLIEDMQGNTLASRDGKVKIEISYRK